MVWLLSLLPLGQFVAMLTKIHGDKHLISGSKMASVLAGINLKIGLRKPK